MKKFLVNYMEKIEVFLEKNEPDAFYARIPYSFLNRVHKVGGKWVQGKKLWRFPLDFNLWENFEHQFSDCEIKKSLAFIVGMNNRKKKQENFLEAKKIAEKDEPSDFGVEGITLNGKNPLFNYQRHGVECGLQVGDGFLIGDVPGLGKAEILDNKVFTPFGRKRIGDIVVGDKVIGSDGLSHNVIGVYPQGLKPVYKITFNDGYSIECAEEHLWYVFDRCKNSYNVLTTGEMLDKELVKEKNGIGRNYDKVYKYSTYYKESDGGNKWQIPIVKPIQFERKDMFLVDPYLMGVLIGDGCFTNHCVTVNENENDFEEIFNPYLQSGCYNARELKKPNAKVRKIAFTINSELKQLGLFGKHSYDKFIPECYKYASVEDRLALLQGLMDTDGHCMKSNKDIFSGTEFSTVSERLSDDVAELVQSLGGIVRKHSKKPFYTKNGVHIYCKTAYRLNIKMPSQLIPFRLKRKISAYHIPQKYDVARFIKDISYVGEKECVCIAVDAPDHLYVTEHCIVTHNTIQGLAIAVERKNRGEIHNCLIVCPASLKYNWLDEIHKFTKEKAIVIGHKAKNKEEREKQWIAEGYFFKIVNYELVARDLYCEPKKIDNRISCANQVLKSYDMAIFDECFSYYSRVLLEDGSLEYIGKIVENKMPVRVMSYNWEQKKFEPKPIVHYFNNGRKQLLSLKTQYGTVQVTSNHKYYKLDGSSVTAGELKDGDKIAVYNKFGFGIERIPLLAGTLLGDGSLSRYSKNSLARLRTSHGVNQIEYAKWKEEIFTNCIGKEINCKNPNTFSKKIYQFCSKSMYPDTIYDIFYECGKKKVTEKWLNQLNEFGLALWYMDEGSNQEISYFPRNYRDIQDNLQYICNNQKTYLSSEKNPSYYLKKYGLKKFSYKSFFKELIHSENPIEFFDKYSRKKYDVCFLHTEGFEKDEVELISKFLKKKFGLENSIVKTKGNKKIFYYHIRFTVSSSKKLIDMISPYVPKCMRYKLNGKGKEYNQKMIDDYLKTNSMLEAKIISIKEWNNRCNYTYNIEVEGNHNYICGGSLVSNCQYLKHHSSARTQACRAIQAKYRIGLSGTPIDGKLEEIHSIFQILKPGLFVNKTQFMARYAEYDYFGSVKGYHRVNEVRDKIAPYYLRRLKEVVFKDLPPKLFKDLHVELSDKNMRDYKKISNGKSEITAEAAAAELVIRARQFLDFPEIIGLHNSSDKYKVFKELMDSLVMENNEKTIVFTQYTNTIKYLVKNLKSDGYKHIMVIDGSVPSEERQEICKKFNNENKPYILIMSDAGCTGLNLQEAKNVVHYTDNFSPAVMQQRNDRAHRATTKHTVVIYRFICDGTIDEHVRNILGQKMAINNAMLDEHCSEFSIGDMSALELMSCL